MDCGKWQDLRDEVIYSDSSADDPHPFRHERALHDSLPVLNCVGMPTERKGAAGQIGCDVKVRDKREFGERSGRC